MESVRFSEEGFQLQHSVPCLHSETNRSGTSFRFSRKSNTRGEKTFLFTVIPASGIAKQNLRIQAESLNGYAGANLRCKECHRCQFMFNVVFDVVAGVALSLTVAITAVCAAVNAAADIHAVVIGASPQ